MTIVNNTVNDVAATVLPDAPIDPATGLQVPTIRIGTTGGISVIENDGTVTSTPSNIYKQSTSDSPDYDLWQRYLFGHSLLVGGSIYAYMSSSWYLRLNNSDGAQIDAWATGGTTKGSPVISRFTQIAFDATGAKNHMTCGMTANYCSGWMPGDIRGAFLADTSLTALVGSGELVTNGTFDTDINGWTAQNANVSGQSVNSQLEVTNNGLGWFYQSFPTVVGQTYRLTVDFVAKQSGGRVFLGTSIGGANILSIANAGSYTLNFVALTTETFISLGDGAGGSGVVNTYDNISVKLVSADRSVKNNGLVVNGTIQRTPVATGAELVAYSGFSATNYLEQPYNPDLDFGTGDFCVMGWATRSEPSDWLLDRIEGIPEGTDLYGYSVWQSGDKLLFDTIENNASTVVMSNTLPSSGTWFHFVCVRENGKLSIYINGILEGETVGQIRDFNTGSGVPAKLFIGAKNRPINMSAWSAGKLALIRVSATAPTLEQVSKIYEDEKFLFQENAACTLFGTSDAVRALAHDEGTGILHVGTSQGRSDFQGLRRVSNTTTPVSTAISASNGLIVEQ